jgi:hypothetical protein
LSSPSAPTRAIDANRGAAFSPSSPIIVSFAHTHGHGPPTPRRHWISATLFTLSPRSVDRRRGTLCSSLRPSHRIIGAFHKFPAFFLFLLGVSEAFHAGFLNVRACFVERGPSRESMAIFLILTKKNQRFVSAALLPSHFVLQTSCSLARIVACAMYRRCFVQLAIESAAIMYYV